MKTIRVSISNYCPFSSFISWWCLSTYGIPTHDAACVFDLTNFGVHKCRTSPTVPIVFQFDEALIEEDGTLGKLQPNALTVDNLTVDWLRTRLQELESSVREVQEKQTKLPAESKPTTPILKALNNGVNGSTTTIATTNGVGKEMNV